jgi:hypothetical protein
MKSVSIIASTDSMGGTGADAASIWSACLEMRFPKIFINVCANNVCMDESEAALEVRLTDELRRLSSLVRSASFMGGFIVVTFAKPPSKNREIMLNAVCEKLLDVLDSEYSFMRETENRWVFKKVV